MARTTILAKSLPGSYPSLPFGAAEADLLFTATDDPVSRQTLLSDNRTVVFTYNTDSVPHTVTFTSVTDQLRRTGDITAYSVAAGKVAAFGPFRVAGWQQAGGQLYIDISSPLLRLAVVQLP